MLRAAWAIPGKKMTHDTFNQNTCDKCVRCGETETLLHILNGCNWMKFKYTKRHDTVQNILRDYLLKANRLNVHANQTIRGSNS